MPDPWEVAQAAANQVLDPWNVITVAKTANLFRDEKGRLVEQLEGLRRRLRSVRQLLKTDKKAGRCGGQELFATARMAEAEVLALFGTATARLIVNTGPMWYISELARIEAALALELGLYLASRDDRAEATCKTVATAELEKGPRSDSELERVIAALKSQWLRKARPIVDAEALMSHAHARRSRSAHHRSPRKSSDLLAQRSKSRSPGRA